MCGVNKKQKILESNWIKRILARESPFSTVRQSAVQYSEVQSSFVQIACSGD